ncbi:MAG: hypothetical protein IJ304_02555 [Clostridia bacterium]|nr:hypothetical protein [Clostridia bacterium]
MKTILNEFKNLSIDKKALQKKIGGDLYNVECEAPEMVNADDVIKIIKSFINNTIKREHLVEWVNVVWFTELFEFDEKEVDSIVSVLQVLETLDEENVDVNEKEFKRMINSLSRNVEYTRDNC